MAWIPMQLMGLNLKNNIGWAQVVKQFIVLVSGIETKSQDEMDKGARENHILSEYSRWVQIMHEKFSEAAVLPYLSYTTGTRQKDVTGLYLYRNFSDGLRVINNEFNPVWAQVLKGRISGTSKEELWARFCYLIYCKRQDIEEPEEVTPADFDWRREELRKWMFAFKYMGPPCELLELGEQKCHEFLQNPKGLGKRNTSQEKRKADGIPPISLPSPSQLFTLFCPSQVCRGTPRERRKRDAPRRPSHLRSPPSARRVR